MTIALPTIAITTGEPAGIGPELIAMLAQRHAVQPFPARLVVLGDHALLTSRAKRIGLEPNFVEFDAAAYPQPLKAPSPTTLSSMNLMSWLIS